MGAQLLAAARSRTCIGLHGGGEAADAVLPARRSSTIQRAAARTFSSVYKRWMWIPYNPSSLPIARRAFFQIAAHHLHQIYLQGSPSSRAARGLPLGVLPTMPSPAAAPAKKVLPPRPSARWHECSSPFVCYGVHA